MYSVDILCVGNELLSGITLNTNAHWLSRKITKMGGFVRRVIVVRDDLSEIKLALIDSLNRNPNWIIVCGGLGPTYDDKTLLGIGKALKKKLTLNSTALDMVKKSYRHRHRRVKINKARLKMAIIPTGSTPIENPEGNAPGILLCVRKTKIICLPGVPIEMKAIATKCILPRIKQEIGDFTIMETNYLIKGISEAMISSRLTKIVDSAPNDRLYLKTHPRGYIDNSPTIRIQLISKGNNEEQVELLNNKILGQITELIRKNKGKILKIS
ncbi:MAG TPA: molybdopterin-binding protein [Nitrososphaeraceae archaeon]|nr:molybdopterin-binding protein [Nitrososphaeraceae archaeon]